MLLMPQHNWQWSYNKTYQALGVLLGDEMEFLTPYSIKLLIPDALDTQEFSMDHARFYITMLERLQRHFSATDAELVQISLNATAAHFMLKPQMPKSWFFQTSDVCIYSDVGKLFELATSSGDRALVLVVENSLQAAQVMLLSDECELADNKHIQRFDTIKVMHNRLQAATKHRHIKAA